MPKPITMKEHRRIMQTLDKSLDDIFGSEWQGRGYPACMRNAKPHPKCRLCGKKREDVREMIRDTCRNCYILGRRYKHKDLTNLAAARIQLARQLRVGL